MAFTDLTDEMIPMEIFNEMLESDRICEELERRRVGEDTQREPRFRSQATSASGPTGGTVRARRRRRNSFPVPPNDVEVEPASGF